MRFATARRALVGLAAAAAGLSATPAAQAFPNGRAPARDLAPIYMPGNRAYLAKPAASAFNTARICAVRSGVDLFPSPSSTRPAQTAYRTLRQQQHLWALYRSGSGALAAYPGTSNHGRGSAVDLALPRMRHWIDYHGRPFRWRKIEAFSEWWHVNYTGGWRAPDPGIRLTSPVLRVGSAGTCLAPFVRDAQRRLHVRATGSFGRGTAAAVKSFQRRAHLRATGVVDPRTWASLRHYSRKIPKASKLRVVRNTPQLVGGPDVQVVQGLLNTRAVELHKPAVVPTDGLYGPSTAAAVKSFQVERHLPATGQVDSTTLTSLAKPSRKARSTKYVTVDGPDVSYYEAPFNPSVIGQHHAFLIFREGDGLTVHDWSFNRKAWGQALRAGLIRGVYHFARPQPGRSGRTEALDFIHHIDAVGQIKPTDFPPIIDLEASSGLSHAGVRAWADQFCLTLQQRYHRVPLIYTAQWFYGDGPRPAHCGRLWVSAYGVSHPTPPPGFKSYLLWQYSESARIAGVPHKVDMSICHCSYSELQSYIRHNAYPHGRRQAKPHRKPKRHRRPKPKHHKQPRVAFAWCSGWFC